MYKWRKELFHVSFSLPVSSLCWPLNRSHSLLLSTYSTQPAHFKLTAPQSPSPFSPPLFSPPPHQSASTHQHSRAAGFSLAAHFAPDPDFSTQRCQKGVWLNRSSVYCWCAQQSAQRCLLFAVRSLQTCQPVRKNPAIGEHFNTALKIPIKLLFLYSLFV